mgnify:CR=1 FL=1|jgi:hypothetical protein
MNDDYECEVYLDSTPGEGSATFNNEFSYDHRTHAIRVVIREDMTFSDSFRKLSTLAATMKKMGTVEKLTIEGQTDEKIWISMVIWIIDCYLNTSFLTITELDIKNLTLFGGSEDFSHLCWKLCHTTFDLSRFCLQNVAFASVSGPLDERHQKQLNEMLRKTVVKLNLKEVRFHLRGFIIHPRVYDSLATCEALKCIVIHNPLAEDQFSAFRGALVNLIILQELKFSLDNSFFAGVSHGSLLGTTLQCHNMLLKTLCIGGSSSEGFLACLRLNLRGHRTLKAFTGNGKEHEITFEGPSDEDKKRSTEEPDSSTALVAFKRRR